MLFKRAEAEGVVVRGVADDAPVPVSFGTQFGEMSVTASPESEDSPAHISIEVDGLVVRIGRSPQDGVHVVELEGPGEADHDADGSPRLRLYVNEENTYESPPFPAQRDKKRKKGKKEKKSR